MAHPSILDTPIESHATPEQIARFGHIAILLRRYLTETGMKPADFHEHVLKLDRNATAMYPWLKGVAKPGAHHAHIIGKTLGVPWSFFKPRELDDPAVAQPETLKVPSSWKPTPSQNVMVLSPPRLGRPAAGDVLSFAIDRTGSVRLKLDVALPLERGSALLRMLLDAGIVLSEPEPQDG